jgi:hypothetical protein
VTYKRTFSSSIEIIKRKIKNAPEINPINLPTISILGDSNCVLYLLAYFMDLLILSSK